jgi:hypothetical protein
VLPFTIFAFRSTLVRSDLSPGAPGMSMYCAGMTSKLAKQKQELNSALLKIIEKDNSIGRLSEQLESKPSIPTPSSSFL